jgi:O-antigen/teichoic acid export membrane protein
VRIVLKHLGVEDYGIYNVVGGIVTMLSFLSGTMASASQRFFSFDLGEGNFKRLRHTFSITLIVYVLISIIIILLAETVGFWFLRTQMNIPTERAYAAEWVYHFSVFSFILTIISIPYTASLISHENMKIYAYIGIIDAIIKLIIVYLLGLFFVDKLKLYAVLSFIETGIISLIYIAYCRYKYRECRFHFCYDKNLLLSIFSYSNWNIIGSIANIIKNQGINILLNIFFGPLVNAARTISFQIYSALSLFITNIYTSTRPQITKYYAQKDITSTWKLVFDSTRVTYYLFMILSIPFFFEIDYILYLWLGSIPKYVPMITRLILIGFLIECSSSQLVCVLQAANKLRKFQSVSSSVLLLNLPVSYLLLKLGGSPYVPFVASIIITIVYIFSQIIIIKKEVGLSVRQYMKTVSLLILVTLLSVIIPCVITFTMDRSTIRFLLLIISTILFSSFIIWSIGISKNEKNAVYNYIKTKIRQL